MLVERTRLHVYVVGLFFVGNSFLLRTVKYTNAFVYLEFYGCYICVDGIYFVTSHGFELLYKGVSYK